MLWHVERSAFLSDGADERMFYMGAGQYVMDMIDMCGWHGRYEGT